MDKLHDRPTPAECKKRERRPPGDGRRGEGGGGSAAAPAQRPAISYTWRMAIAAQAERSNGRGCQKTEVPTETGRVSRPLPSPSSAWRAHTEAVINAARVACATRCHRQPWLASSSSPLCRNLLPLRVLGDASSQWIGNSPSSVTAIGKHRCWPTSADKFKEK